MDLLNAKKEAAKKSSANNGKAIYINVDEEGECLLMPTADHTTYAAFRGGHEIAVPVAPTLKSTFKNKLSKHLNTKKMKLPDELPEELDLPQGVELPKENKPKKKVKKSKLNRAAKVVKLTPDDSEGEQPIESLPEMKPSGKRPKSRGKAKPLKVKQLAKKGTTKKLVDVSEPVTDTKKGKSVRTQGGKVERKAKIDTTLRKRKAIARAPKNKPSALDLENARKTLATWAKEREQTAKDSPKRATKKPLKKVAKKLPPTKKKK